MKIWVTGIAVLLIILLVAGLGAFTMPSLLSRPMVPQLMQSVGPQMPAKGLTPEDVKTLATEETFTLSVSGNIYFDKLPVQGAEVTICLNGQPVGKTTAGDVYMFSVPGVRMGDTVRVDASYEGFTGTVTEQVKFKSMSINVNIKSGRSFIRNALEMLPKKDDLTKAQQNRQQQQPAQQQSQQTRSQPSGSMTTTSKVDANKLTSQILSDTSNMLGSMMGQASGAITDPPVASTADVDNGLKITDLNDAVNAAGISGLPG